MLYAVKGNKQYTIQESEKETYKKSGFDIYENVKGKTKKIEDAFNKTVNIAELNKVKAELEAEKTKNASAEIADLEDKIKVLEAEKEAIVLEADTKFDKMFEIAEKAKADLVIANKTTEDLNKKLTKGAK